MSGYDITPIFKDAWLIYEREEQVCMYLICGSERAALIDAGMGTGDLFAVAASLTDLPVLPLITHGHPDHYLGAMSCPFIYLDERDHPLMQYYVELDALEEGVSAPPMPKLKALPESFDLGGRTLRVVDLHGHTAGSVGYLLEEEKILFSGDGLIYNVWMQLEESTTLREYRTTLEALRSIRPCFNSLWTGHGTKALDAEHLERVIALVDKVIESPFGVPNPSSEPPGVIADGVDCQITYRKDKIERNDVNISTESDRT